LIGDPYGSSGCQSPNECSDNNDCIGDQICQKNGDGIFKCVDPCASAVCGNNANCKVVSRKPVCECLGGYFGDPNDLTVGCIRGDCIIDEDCPGNENCENYKS
jgi:hypothetical protein